MSEEASQFVTVELGRHEKPVAEALIRSALRGKTKTLGGEQGFITGDLIAFRRDGKIFIEAPYEIIIGIHGERLTMRTMERGTAIETGTALIVAENLQQLLDRSNAPTVYLIPPPTDSMRASSSRQTD